MLDYDDDVTYYAGPVYLWSLAESTCVMLVFCIPPIPRIFATAENMEKQRRSAQRFASRTLASSKSVGGSSNDVSPSPPDEARRDDFRKEPQDFRISTPAAVDLADLRTMVYPDPTGKRAEGQDRDGILCTRTFGTHEHYKYEV